MVALGQSFKARREHFSFIRMTCSMTRVVPVRRGPGRSVSYSLQSRSHVVDG